MQNIQIIRIPADTTSPTELITIDAELSSLQEQVGGYIEEIAGGTFPYAPNGSWVGYINEEGKLQNLPANPRATAFFRTFGRLGEGDYIAGTAILAGCNDDGDTLSIPVGFVRANLLELLNRQH